NISLKSDDTYLWTKSAGGVELKVLKNPGPYKGCQNFPVVADPDYVIEAWFTNSVEGGADVGLTIPVGDQQRTTCWFWPGDGGWAGFGKVDGQDPQSPDIEKGCSTSFQLVPGELTFVRTEVRRTPSNVDLRFMVNGRLMGDYRGPTSRLNMSTAWYVGSDPEQASIGGRAVTFHRVTVQKLDLETEKKQAVPAALLTADPRIDKLEAGFKAAYDIKAQKPYIAAVAALNQSYITNGIARALTQANGKSDEVAALDAEKTAIEKGEGVPAEDAADTSESVKALRNTYRIALAKLEADRTKAAAPLYDIYLKALDAYIIELTRADKIQQAQDVQAFREKIAQQKNQVATPAPKPATPAPKAPEFSWRKAAEYIVSAGSSCRLAKEGQEFDVQAGQAIPDGTFDIVELHFDRLGSTLPPPTDADFQVLNGLKTLRVFHVRAVPQLTDAAFAFLADNPALTSLKLENTGVSDGVLKNIAGFKNLKTLHIHNSPAFTGKGIEQAAYLPVLEDLTLYATQFDDAGIAALQACQNVKRLHLYRTEVTDVGLQKLRSLQSLTWLTISLTKATDNAIVAFKTAKPQCKVD
ncbi:MAG: hypothetical protein ABL974_18335, partial [Prosthecobacter sp.]